MQQKHSRSFQIQRLRYCDHEFFMSLNNKGAELIYVEAFLHKPMNTFFLKSFLKRAGMASDKKPEILGSSPTVSSRVALG
jgi:hypothetical protein